MLDRSLVNRHSLVECSLREEGSKETATIDLNHVVEEAGELVFVGREINSGAHMTLNFRSVVRVDGQPLESLYQQLKRRR
jgi:hypothetical protein